jgi:Cu/Ag efflux pump CusA
MSFSTVPQNFGDYSIQLKQKRTQKTVDVIDDLRKEIALKQPVLDISFGQRIADLLGDLMSTPQPIEVKFFGDSYAELQDISKKAETIITKIQGVADVNNGLRIASPSLVFTPKQDILSQYKISLLDFQTQLSAYTGGVTLGINANQPVPSLEQNSAIVRYNKKYKCQSARAFTRPSRHDSGNSSRANAGWGTNETNNFTFCRF